jgi:hypothetical protein
MRFRIGMMSENVFNFTTFGFHNMNITSPTGLQATGNAKGIGARRLELSAKLSF